MSCAIADWQWVGTDSRRCAHWGAPPPISALRRTNALLGSPGSTFSHIRSQCPLLSMSPNPGLSRLEPIGPIWLLTVLQMKIYGKTACAFICMLSGCSFAMKTECVRSVTATWPFAENILQPLLQFVPYPLSAGLLSHLFQRALLSPCPAWPPSGRSVPHPLPFYRNTLIWVLCHSLHWLLALSGWILDTFSWLAAFLRLATALLLLSHHI